MKKWEDYHICANADDGGACNGDSGGPLVCEVNGHWKLAGAASFVFGKCSTKKPTVYTDVGFFRSRKAIAFPTRRKRYR